MDGIANVAQQQQQTQASTGQTQGRATQTQQVQQQVEQVKKEEASNTEVRPKINSKEQVKELVDQLNKSLAPMNTNIKFGVDSQDVFFVSVIESESSKLLRRFPAEQAADFLPKMQEVTGLLFDTKG